MHDGWEQVYLYILIRDGDDEASEVELMLPTLFFDPEEPEEDAIERVVELLGITESEAIARLRRADLLAQGSAS
jgi:hypothetical protein